MAQSESKKDQDDPPEDFRWELALLYQRRADESGTTLRALLLLISTGLLGFVVGEHKDSLPSLHLLPIILFSVAIAVLVKSWALQKNKSICRWKTLRNAGYRAFLDLEKKIQSTHTLRNEVWDRWSYLLIALGAFSELVLLSFPAAPISELSGLFVVGVAWICDLGVSLNPPMMETA
ncbi:MAG: hypothetical protein RLO08_17845 [Parvibaculaceae bacterium]